MDIQQQQQQPSPSSLSPLLPILNAFNHRHHNQHRLAHWWPVFRILRRTLRALVHDLSASSTSTPSSSRPFRREAAAAAAASPSPPPPPRAIWLSKHFIPRAYIAFSQLAADNQHAPLGLLLLAILARVHAVLAQLLDHTTATTSTSTSTTPSTTTAKPLSSSYNRSIDAAAAAAANQDKGIAISRDAHHSRPVIQSTERLRTVHQQQQQQQQTASSSSTRHSSDEPPRGEVAHEPEAMTAKPSRTKSKEASLKDDKKKKKKKRGKGDELSSLFGSLA